MKTVSMDLTSHGRVDGRGKARLEPDSSLVELISRQTSEGRAMTGPPSNGGGELRLTPREPPGRANRKARAYTTEILRLHELGYSFDVIREALADIGVKVSLSTVRREAIRCTKASPAAASAAAAPPG